MFTYKLVGCDTDSIKFCNENGEPMSEDDMDLVLNAMNDATPKGIRLEKDGYYDKFLVIKSKNYVTVKENKIKYKGSSILDSKKEPALLELMKLLINEVLNDSETEKLVIIYNKYCKEAYNELDIKRWVTKKTITESVLKAERLNEQKVFDASTDAIKNGVINGIQAGDKILVYQAVDGEIQHSSKGELSFFKNGDPKMIPNNILKFAELYNNNHDRWHYVKRVYKTLCILENVVDITKFINYSLKKNQDLLV